MGYCVLADLVTRFTEKRILTLSDFDIGSGTIGVDQEARVTAAITQAEGYINGRLAGAFPSSVPFTAVPDQVKEAAIDLSFFYLARRGGSGELRTGQNLKDGADELLGMIVDGDMNLTTAGVPSDRDLIFSTTSGAAHEFRESFRNNETLEVESLGNMDIW